MSISPLLSDEQRDREFNDLSPDECGLIVAYVADQHRAVFDEALMALKRLPAHLEEVA